MSRNYTQRDLREQCERRGIYGQGTIDMERRIDPNLLVGEPLSDRLSLWYSGVEQKYLWFTAHPHDARPTRITLAAALMHRKLVNSLDRSIIHMCDVAFEGGNRRRVIAYTDADLTTSAPMVDLVYSLLQQAIMFLPSFIETSFDFSARSFDALDFRRRSLDHAIDMLAEVIRLGPAVISFIITDLQLLDTDNESRRILRRLIPLLIDKDTPPSWKVRKALFATVDDGPDIDILDEFCIDNVLTVMNDDHAAANVAYDMETLSLEYMAHRGNWLHRQPVAETEEESSAEA